MRRRLDKAGAATGIGVCPEAGDAVAAEFGFFDGESPGDAWNGDGLARLEPGGKVVKWPLRQAIGEEQRPMECGTGCGDEHREDGSECCGEGGALGELAPRKVA